MLGVLLYIVTIISIVTLNKGIWNNLAYMIDIHWIATYPFGFPQETSLFQGFSHSPFT